MISTWGDLAPILRELGRIHDSEHLQAAIEILPFYLDAAFESGRLGKVLAEKISRVYSKNEAGHLTLDKERALKEHEALMKALAHLERDEIRQITINLMQQKLGIKVDKEPLELTAHIPVVINGSFNDESGPNNLVLLEGLNNVPKSLELSIRQATSVGNSSEQSKQIIDLVGVVGRSEVEQALTIARAIRQRFPREKALIAVANQAVDSGDIANAVLILREAEALIESEKSSFGNNFSFYQDLGDSFLIYPELIALKNRIGLEVESHALLTRIESQLLSLDSSEMGMSEYEVLLDVAKRKAAMGYKEEALDLISKVRENIELNTSDYFDKESALFETFLITAEVDGGTEYGKKIAKRLAKGFRDSKTYKRSLQVLASLGSKEEIIAEANRIDELVSNESNFSAGYYYTCIADALYRVGERERARELRIKALEDNTKIAERQKDHGGYDWGFEHQAIVMLEHPDLLDEAVGVAMNIDDFSKRGSILIRIGKKYIESGESQKGLAVLERAGQYLSDKSQRTNLNLLIQSYINNKFELD